MANIDVCSIVVPVYNGSKTLHQLVERVCKTFDNQKSSFEIIFVDDFSQDNSWLTMLDLKKEFSKIDITIIKLAKNYGQHRAIACGINNSKGDIIITLDDDLQVPPEEIPKLIEYYKENEFVDVVYGVYKVKKHSTVRNWGSLFVAYIFKTFGTEGGAGKGSSFKLIKREVALDIASHNMSYLYIDEIINWYTNYIHYVEVNHDARAEGKSGYNFFKLVAFTLNIILNYTSLPLRIMTYTGLLSSLISLGFGGYFIYKKVVIGASIGFTATIVAILFSTSIILLSLGIIGEYLRRIFAVSQMKSAYRIQKIIK
jgi:polyisoprenyl-phosphate glycosyltransferase